MDTSIALPVMRYLHTLNVHDPIYAYLGIDHHNVVRHSGGSIEQFGLDGVSEGSLALEHLNYLEGLLPSDDNPVIIENTQFMSERFVDLHLVSKDGFQWVVFIDNTEAGKARQTEQQRQLNSDIKTEARKR